MQQTPQGQYGTNHTSTTYNIKQGEDSAQNYCFRATREELIMESSVRLSNTELPCMPGNGYRVSAAVMNCMSDRQRLIAAVAAFIAP